MASFPFEAAIKEVGFGGVLSYSIALASIIVSGTLFLSALDKRIALLEQHDSYVSGQLSDIKYQVDSMQQKQDKIYLLLAKSRNL